MRSLRDLAASVSSSSGASPVILFVGALLVLGLAGCTAPPPNHLHPTGSGARAALPKPSPTPSTPATSSADGRLDCSIFTPAVLSKLLIGRIGHPLRLAKGAYSGCDFGLGRSADAPRDDIVGTPDWQRIDTLSIGFVRHGGADYYAKVTDPHYTLEKGRVLTGFADAAWTDYLPGVSLEPYLDARLGDEYCSIYVSPTEPEQVRAPAAGVLGAVPPVDFDSFLAKEEGLCAVAFGISAPPVPAIATSQLPSPSCAALTPTLLRGLVTVPLGAAWPEKTGWNGGTACWFGAGKDIALTGDRLTSGLDHFVVYGTTSGGRAVFRYFQRQNSADGPPYQLPHTSGRLEYTFRLGEDYDPTVYGYRGDRGCAVLIDLRSTAELGFPISATGENGAPIAAALRSQDAPAVAKHAAALCRAFLG